MDNIKNLLSELKTQLAGQEISESGAREYGEVVSVGDGVALVTGLPGASYGHLLNFDDKALGLAMNLKPDFLEAVLLTKTDEVKKGTRVFLKAQRLSIGVGEGTIGRVISPLGDPLDGQGPIRTTEFYPLEETAPGIIERQPVKEPLPIGILAVDAITPIGLGQRELIIGDRTTGKTALAITAIINQKYQDQKIHCIYVAISQKQSKVAKIVEKLRSSGALAFTTVVAAFPSDGPTMSYLAPFAGCSLGEYFRNNGQHALIVYDDLSKHAVSYRELSLLLKRPSGREAYPGDIFYLHSRLLERAAKLSDAKGGGSLTALPIIETQDNDVSSYIPTNVISITDGQIYLESDLFNSGVKPAINVGLSVSRVGGAAQRKTLKKAAGTLRLDLSQYRDLAAFAQFGSDLDEKTKSSLRKGELITKLLTQKEYQVYSTGEQVVVLLLIGMDLLSNISKDHVIVIIQDFLQRLNEEKNIISEINLAKSLEESLKQKVKLAWEEFYKTQYGHTERN
jgi:F-type H+-transporting ATPase subunit alpha